MQDIHNYDRIIEQRELSNMVPFHRSQIKRMEAAGHFPQRIRLSESRVGWSLFEVVQWMEARKAERFAEVNTGDERGDYQ